MSVETLCAKDTVNLDLDMIYSFGRFTLDTARAELAVQERVVDLEPKAFDLLVFLVENRHRVVTKDDIHKAIWPGVFVSDASISQSLKQIRRALGDDGKSQGLIKTLRGKGFRFTAAVDAPRSTLMQASPKEHSGSSREQCKVGSRPTVAVLPFVLIQTDDTHSAIAEGLPAELISALSRLRSIRVIARGTMFQFDPVSPDLATIRDHLGAGYVLSGSVELFNRHLGVNVELTATSTNEVVWSETYAGDLEDLFSIRQEIAREVCNAVETHIPLKEAELLARVPTEHLDAWGHYHIGLRYLLWFRGAKNDLAKHHMQLALALDPNFARAQSALAYAELEDNSFDLVGDAQNGSPQGFDRAERAVELDPLDPFCNLVLGRAHWIAEDLDGALSWAQRSVQLNLNYAIGHYELGKFNAIACAGEEADSFAATALSLSPLDPNVSGMLSTRALAAFVRGDKDNALRFANESIRAPNRHEFVFAVAAAIYGANGEMDRAEQAAASIKARNNDFSMTQVKHLFSLRDPTLQTEMFTALQRLGFK